MEEAIEEEGIMGTGSINRETSVGINITADMDTINTEIIMNIMVIMAIMDMVLGGASDVVLETDPDMDVALDITRKGKYKKLASNNKKLLLLRKWILREKS